MFAMVARAFSAQTLLCVCSALHITLTRVLKNMPFPYCRRCALADAGKLRFWQTSSEFFLAVSFISVGSIPNTPCRASMKPGCAIILFGVTVLFAMFWQTCRADSRATLVSLVRERSMILSRVSINPGNSNMGVLVSSWFATFLRMLRAFSLVTPCSPLAIFTRDWIQVGWLSISTRTFFARLMFKQTGRAFFLRSSFTTSQIPDSAPNTPS
mmetsp:Transcript_20784/g.41570  ORF Transcript_20784/g.41570 Transcript_20784/m.41570 type:complete len:212 (-) Transcript_20784:1305-1940(-)